MKKETQRISLIDIIIRLSVIISISLLIFIVYLVHEPEVIESNEIKKIKKEIELLNEDIQRTETALAIVYNKIDTIEKIKQLNTKKETKFKTLNNQLEKASKNVPKY